MNLAGGTKVNRRLILSSGPIVVSGEKSSARPAGGAKFLKQLFRAVTQTNTGSSRHVALATGSVLEKAGAAPAWLTFEDFKVLICRPGPLETSKVQAGNEILQSVDLGDLCQGHRLQSSEGRRHAFYEKRS